MIEVTGAIGIAQHSRANRWHLCPPRYRIHIDAIAENIIPQTISKLQAGLIYASEADVLNMALFGITAKQWREQNNTKHGNMLERMMSCSTLAWSRMESINTELIRQSISQGERLLALNNTAIHQMRSLLGAVTVLKIK